MTYNPTTGGHAPSDLRDAFLSAIEGFVTNGSLPSNMDTLCGQLWNCTDTLPGAEAAALDLPAVSSYAKAARRLRSRG